MLKYIQTKSFGVLSDGKYVFTDGFNIVRAPNEGGKTTLIEAFLYGLFGAQTLRGTVEEVTTDGRTGLKVTVKYGEYTVKRSKSSAAVVGPEVKITGQGNVTNFFHDLFGTSKGTLESVIVSEQGETAGILKAKPTAVTTLIENLAGFDQIDDLIEAVKVKYPTGDVKVYREMVEDTQTKLNIVEAQVFDGVKEVTVHLKDLLVEVKGKEKELKKVTTELQEKKEDLAGAKANNRELDALTVRRDDLRASVIVTKERITALKETAALTIPGDTKEKEYVDAYPEMKSKAELYERITKFVWLGEYWEGDFESLETEIKTILKDDDKQYKKISGLEHDIKQQKNLLNTEDNCPTCGQSVKHLHEKLNREATEKLELFNAQHEDMSALHEKAKEYFFTLDAISSAQEPRQEYEKFAVDVNVLPWELKWKGSPLAPPDHKKLLRCKDHISKVWEVKNDVDQAKKRLEERIESLASYENKLQEAAAACIKVKFIDTDKQSLQVLTLQQACDDIVGDIKAHGVTQKSFESRIFKVETLKQRQQARIKELKQDIKDLNIKIELDDDNGVILKEMRKAKPIVMSKVWNRILVAVSTVFSHMRDEPSLVERREKGFYINNLPVHRLSGSAKSVLGIAVRQTLRDVFAPDAGLLIFDEPAADCDVTRTALVISAIKSIPGQVLMITHEDVSDMSADNIIEV